MLKLEKDTRSLTSKFEGAEGRGEEQVHRASGESASAIQSTDLLHMKNSCSSAGFPAHRMMVIKFHDCFPPCPGTHGAEAAAAAPAAAAEEAS